MNVIWRACGAVCLSLLGGCGGIGDLPEGKQHVPVAFVVRSAGADPAPAGRWNAAGNPAVDNMRDLYVDKVRVNLYKRPAGTYEDPEKGFMYEGEMLLDCTEPSIDSGDDYRYAYGTVDLERGYEYRATAIAYADGIGESSLFSFVAGGGFGDSEVVLTDQDQYTTPELFFGTLRLCDDRNDPETGEDVFVYEKGMELEGWLYRCVAGVELTLKNVPEDVTEIALLSDRMHTECRAGHYDDFLNPGGERMVPSGHKAFRFELAKWERSADLQGSVDATLAGGNLFPVTSVLSVRFVKGGEAYVVTLRMKDASEADAGDDPGLAKGQVTFLRNHYYSISGDFQALADEQLFLSIAVNPDWCGDADLTLGDR